MHCLTAAARFANPRGAPEQEEHSESGVTRCRRIGDETQPSGRHHPGRRKYYRKSNSRLSGCQVFERAETADGRAVVFFTHAESGLMAAIKDGLAEPKEDRAISLTLFELTDQSGTWHPAEATIRGATSATSVCHAR